MDSDTVYSVQEIADLLKIKKPTVYNLIKRGELSAYLVGNKMRVSSRELERYKHRALRSGTSAAEDVLPSETPYSEVSALVDEPVRREPGPILCGQDAALDILARLLQSRPPAPPVLRSYVGSYNGLYMLYQGQVSAATAHLWDGKTGEYNRPYVERMLPGTPAVIIHLFQRMQGFYVRRGNPKNISSWRDLARSGVVMVNREKGSGTRVLLDEHLRLEGISPAQIAGYSRECYSHLAVAGIVSRGGADVGMGTIAVTRSLPHLEFVPLQEESYDLVIKREDFSRPFFQSLLRALRSEEFAEELRALDAYRLDNLGTVVAET